MSILLIMSVLSLLACGQQGLSVEDAYVRAAIPGKDVTAGFMRINNHGTTAVELVGVSSTASERIEMHEHRHDNGTMRMREVKTIAIAPGSHTALAPGGYHLMIFGLAKELQAGNSVALQLSFSDGSVHTIDAVIKSLL